MKSTLSLIINNKDIELYNAKPESIWSSVWFDSKEIVYAHETRLKETQEAGILLYLECGEEIIVPKSAEIITMLDNKFAE